MQSYTKLNTMCIHATTRPQNIATKETIEICPQTTRCSTFELEFARFHTSSSAIQCREDDLEIRNILENLNHDETKKCVNTERNILKILEGDCDTAIGAYAKVEDGKIYVEAELFSLDGSKRFYVKSSKELKYADQLGKEVGIILKKKSKESHKK